MKKEVKKYIEEQSFKIAKEIGVTPKRISIKDTSSCWGSCSSNGNLSFSWRLGFAPVFIIDYVIAHELTHLIQMNHSDDFWRTLRQINPDVMKARKWLKENGCLLHKYR
ncbi:MAG: M48 family metallopeptidase [Alphaproteobacteria bacterium]|nr:M48 family metallopeptidase [Alphaproteobacteria bacterium]